MKALLRGEMSLFRTFWGWAVLGNLLPVLPFVWADVTMDRRVAVPTGIAYFAVTAYLFRFLYFPFPALAVLRSAENYPALRR